MELETIRYMLTKVKDDFMMEQVKVNNEEKENIIITEHDWLIQFVC